MDQTRKTEMEVVMNFQVGDPVVHWSHGIGKITGIEERMIADRQVLYYLVQIRDLTVCVPVDGDTSFRLRPPTSSQDFHKLFAILSSPGIPLPDDRLDRKSHLHGVMADGTLQTICEVVRDLTHHSRRKQLNEDDKNTLKRASSMLCNEWAFSLSLSLPEVEEELNRLLAPVSADPAPASG